MPIYVYWGDDEFALEQSVTSLRQRVLDADWSNFNFDKITADQADTILQGLNQAITPPFGAGKRLVWLCHTSICQRCSEELFTELERTLPNVPDTSVLLLTTRNKPDGRLKSTKLLLKYAEVREFSVIPPWKTDLLIRQVQQVAKIVGVQLTERATEALAEAVGNDTRQLYSELEKIRLYSQNTEPVNEGAIAALVSASAQNTLQLGSAIRQGEVAQALDLVNDLLQQNEPALVIVKSLVGQFRTWIWVKLMLETGERNEQAIAQAAEISNPKRIFFLKKEVESLALPRLLQTLPLLLEMESSLKYGADELSTLQTKVIELCQQCQSPQNFK